MLLVLHRIGGFLGNGGYSCKIVLKVDLYCRFVWGLGKV
jgi:hypothetical protein